MKSITNKLISHTTFVRCSFIYNYNKCRTMFLKLVTRANITLLVLIHIHYPIKHTHHLITDWFDCRDVIDKVPFAQVQRNLAIRRALLEHFKIHHHR